MPEPGLSSKTPILDLEQPLPLPPKTRKSGPKAVVVLTVIAVFVLKTFFIVVIVLGYLGISLAVTAIHEFGHWLAGRCVGMRLSYLVIGPVKFMLQSGQWRVYRRSQFTGGLILMSLEKVRRVRRRLIVTVAGGPAISLTTGAIALLFCRAERVGGNPRIGLPVAAFAILSLLAGILGLRNLKFRGYAGDGVILRMLSSSYEGAKQQIAAHALQMLYNKGWDASLWNRRWMSMASSPTEAHPTTFHSDWLHYLLSDDPLSASEHLERCLAGLALLPPDQREENTDQVYLEASVFMALHRNDPHKAQTWFERAKHPDRASPILRKKAKIALNYTRENYDLAITQLDQGLSLLEQLPPGIRVQRLISSWKEWRSLITAKQRQALSILQ